MKRKRSYSRLARQGLSLLGKLIRAGRIERGMSATALAERAGVSRTTLHNIEKGAPGPEIGIVFELAAIVGVQLFNGDERALASHEARLDEKLTLLPQRVHSVRQDIDDDF